VYDSESDTEDIAANSLDRLCDFVMSVEPEQENPKLRDIYREDSFYKMYTSFNQQEQEPKYN
jgi:hypothetical protein